MDFCQDCGTLLPADRAHGECDQCGTEFGDPSAASEADVSTESADDAGHRTELESLPTTSSNSVKKADAMAWLKDRDRPSTAELRRSVIEKPSDFTGSTFPADISTVRLTGDPQFIETVAGLFSWVVEMEDYGRRVEVNLKETEDRETGDDTGNYALYLSVAERG